MQHWKNEHTNHANQNISGKEDSLNRRHQEVVEQGKGSIFEAKEKDYAEHKKCKQEYTSLESVQFNPQFNQKREQKLFRMGQDVSDKHREQNNTERTLTNKEKRYFELSEKEERHFNQEKNKMDRKLEDGVSEKEIFSFGLKSEIYRQKQQPFVSEGKKSALHSLPEKQETKPSHVWENKKKRKIRKQIERFQQEEKGDDSKTEDGISTKETSPFEVTPETDRQKQQPFVSEGKKSALHSLPEKKEAEPSSLQKEKRKKQMRKQMEKFHQEEKEVYDPLSKDMDNDAAMDRYDVDVRDSKVSYKAVSEEERGEGREKKQETGNDSDDLRNKMPSKKKRYSNDGKKIYSKEPSKAKVEQKKYFKSNFEEQEFTRSKEKEEKTFKQTRDLLREKNSGGRITSAKEQPNTEPYSKKIAKKFEKQEKKLSKLKHKQQVQEKKLKNNKTAETSKGAIAAIGAVNRYLESGKEENAGIDAAYKVTDRAENIARKLYHHGQKKVFKKQKKSMKLSKKIEKKEKKLFFQRNMEELKNKSEYQNSSRLRQFFKRRQYKKQIQKKYKQSIKHRVKKSLIEGRKRFSEFVKARGKKAIFLILMIAGIFFMLFQAGSMMMNMGTGMVGNTVSTTYLSSEEVLKDINQAFSSLEQGLHEEMESVEEHHPGYDEYIIKGKENIGHDVHELLSYITARYGVVKEVSEIESELQTLFHQMYHLTYKEEIEIRYRTETTTYFDENGNEQTTTIEVPYEYKKLIVNLEKREMDAIIREVFRSYPDNLSHYETLLASKGNMELIFGGGSGNLSEIINNPDFGNPGLEFDEESVKRIVAEAEKHLGKKYLFGANGPNNFDCSSFVCWVYTHSGIKNMPRTTAWGIYKSYCNPVSPSDAKPGDIIFFKNTYDSGSPISHVGIYVGGGYMIHAGDPIQYTSINTKYWKEHFYGFGRP